MPQARGARRRNRFWGVAGRPRSKGWRKSVPTFVSARTLETGEGLPRELTTELGFEEEVRR